MGKTTVLIGDKLLQAAIEVMEQEARKKLSRRD